jgi:hypothetical protein
MTSIKFTAAQERRARDWLEKHFVELDQLYNKRCATSLIIEEVPGGCNLIRTVASHEKRAWCPTTPVG